MMIGHNRNNVSGGALFLFGLLLGGGIAAAGWMLADAVKSTRLAERVVSVKGLAERIEAADLAIWPLVYTNHADDLTALQSSADADFERVQQYLLDRGFNADELSRSAPRITDLAAQSYGGNAPPQRYQSESVVTVRSQNVSAVRQAMAESGALVAEGVALVRSYEHTVDYRFTGLNEIKPEMIAAANRNAREAAEQFARDSGSSVGQIRRAEQGFFSIADRDPHSPEFKRIRVVTRVDYGLVEGRPD